MPNHQAEVSSPDSRKKQNVYNMLVYILCKILLIVYIPITCGVTLYEKICTATKKKKKIDNKSIDICSCLLDNVEILSLIHC